MPLVLQFATVSLVYELLLLLTEAGFDRGAEAAGAHKEGSDPAGRMEECNWE